jgi:hypothetical protein
VAVDPHGDAYIADGATSQIWRLDPAGRLLSRWGRGRGDAPGQFRFDRAGPAGIAADLQGHIYVAASSNDGGALFSDPRPVFGAFNVNRALPDGGQYFLGDYQGLVAVGAEFHPFFVAGNTGNKEDPVDVFTGALQP